MGFRELHKHPACCFEQIIQNNCITQTIQVVTAAEVRMNSLATFSDSVLHMDTPLLADQKKTNIHQLFTDAEYCLEDLPRTMVSRDGWQEGVRVNGTPW